MPTKTFSLNLPRHKALLFYGADKSRVLVTTTDGLRLSIPWQLLQPYVTQHGIQGQFDIVFDEHGKCRALTPRAPNLQLR